MFWGPASLFLFSFVIASYTYEYWYLVQMTDSWYPSNTFEAVPTVRLLYCLQWGMLQSDPYQDDINQEYCRVEFRCDERLCIFLFLRIYSAGPFITSFPLKKQWKAILLLGMWQSLHAVYYERVMNGFTQHSKVI